MTLARGQCRLHVVHRRTGQAKRLDGENNNHMGNKALGLNTPRLVGVVGSGCSGHSVL